MSIKRVVKQFPRLYRFLLFNYPYLSAIKGFFQGRRGSRDHIRSTKSLITKSSIIAGRPINITIEPTNLCNLDCPVCETGAGILGRPDGSMSLDQFKTIIDKVSSHTNTLMFYFMGEPFLNKQAYDMIRYAKDEGIPWITTCTNGDPVKAEKLVKSGIDEVSFQIGGITQETHQVYRINSNLKRVLKNLKDTVRLKRELNSNIRIECGFIVMKHNEHEVEEFLRLMKEIGVDEANIVDPCVRDMKQGELYLPADKKYWYYDLNAYAKGELKPKVLPDNHCSWIYYSIAILVNGDVVPCCRDPQGKHVMGNLLSQDLAEIWNGEPYRDFRQSIHNDQGDVDICQLCSSYPASVVK